MTIELVLVAVGIGMLVGAVGIGGIFLPSALSVIAGLAIHQSMATSLFTFIFTGVAGTLAFQRRGSIDWQLAKPIGLGAALSGWAGAWTGSFLNAATLSLILAFIIVFAGIYTFKRSPARQIPGCGSRNWRQWLLLACVGAGTGFISGLTGVGGPVLSVPLMLVCGFPVLTSIGVSQVIQIVGAISGTAANLHLGTIDFRLAAGLAFFAIAGVTLGAHLIHRVDMLLAKRFIGALCVLVGVVSMLRSLAAF
jgi:uncharacterized membrane protein YfcA